MKHILFIIGSLRKNSFNRRIAQQAAHILEGKAQVSYLDYTALPLMNQDIEFPTPEVVAQVRQQVLQADGIWIFTPEYNHSYPGLLKNLIDWLSRPMKQGDFGGATALAGRKICLSGAGGRSATADCLGKLTELLTFVRAEVMTSPRLGVALAPASFMTDELTLTESQVQTLRQEAEAFLAFI